MDRLQLNQQLFEFILDHIDDDPYELALKAKQYPQIDVSWAAKQIEWRKKLKQKLPEWYLSNKPLFFDSKLTLEQSSSEPTARYKQQFVPEGGKVVDLTLGMGVDAFYLSQVSKLYRGYEIDELRGKTTCTNLSLVGASVEVIIGDGTKDSFNGFDLIYLDPARRGAMNRKVFVLEDCQPNVLLHITDWLNQVPRVLLKLSPMIDLRELIRQLPCIKEIHCVSVLNEMKEVLVLMERGFDGEPRIIACAITDERRYSDSFFLSEERKESIVYANRVATFLYEPFSSHLKTGMYKLLSSRFSVDQLAEHSHLYTSFFCVDNFPGRIFQVDRVLPFSSKWCKRDAKQIEKANVTGRNFPISVREFRRKTGIEEGGDKYIFLTTLSKGEKVMILCRKHKD